MPSSATVRKKDRVRFDEPAPRRAEPARAVAGPHRFGLSAGPTGSAGAAAAARAITCGQGPALDELHGVEVDAALAADGEDRDDVRVVQLRRGLGLVLEPLQLARVERGREGQHLQGHAAAQRDLLGLVDDAHAAAADLADGCGSRPGFPGRDRRSARDCPGSRPPGSTGLTAARRMNSRLARQASRSSARSGCSASKAALVGAAPSWSAAR